MKHRQSDPAPVAAAKAGISRATAYRLLKGGKLPSYPDVATASEPSATTNNDTADVTSSRTPPAA